ncbi:patched domain-containing protein 3-like [Scleropages formosus]|uniref:Patched domain-containing protein 3 n=1 Tax=Scleropages formosus TaxID=113540 RepID=A0A0P7UKR8_SCLFO|nr:patched domain-containing protein 3-like [Scleropages formosus]
MPARPTDCVQKPLCNVLHELGRLVGQYPWYFLVVPLLISAAFGTGFLFLKEREALDIEDQFTPVDGPAKKERRFVQDHFPHLDSHFSPLRLHTEGVYASLIAVSLSSSIFSQEALEEVLHLDRWVRRLTVQSTHHPVTYAQLCVRDNGRCASNIILDILNETAGQTELTFPFHQFHSHRVFLGSRVGGMQVNSSRVQSARAIQLFYYLTEDNITQSFAWLHYFTAMFSNGSIPELHQVSVSHFTSLSRQDELKGNSKSVIPFFSVTYFLAITFSILSCSRFDCVRNKVWVAIFGVLSAGLAVLSSFGMLLLCGAPFPLTVATSPFLILGIGVDDMFIMISCWQQTSVLDQVEARLANTYKEAAVSISITTLTDILAFYIGIMMPFRSVQSFCLYTGTAVLFCYIYNTTFFGAFLALNGRREEHNRHWLTCMKVPKESVQERSKSYNICCVGGAYDKTTNTEKTQPMNNFFKKYYGPFLTKTWTKVFVVFLYIGYVAVSIYGCFHIQEGIDLRNLAPDDSYIVNHYTNEEMYFSEYGPNVMVVVTDKEFPYWNESDRTTLALCLQDFQKLPFVDSEIFISWLAAYESYANQTKINLSNETIFKTNLLQFLSYVPEFNQDINLTDDEILASRFFIQTVNVSSTLHQKNMLNTLRETAAQCPVPLLVYHPAFIYYDQYVVIVSNTINNIVVATMVMLTISLLLIPNPICSLWVTFAIASVIAGVTGFMALWNVNLDSVSMINLVICIGFSVDFSAHISYAFVSSKQTTADEKAVDALCNLGYPVMQGAVSTLLGVVVLSATKSYIFRTFFKIMFLVISFGLLHAIVFIPVFLMVSHAWYNPAKAKIQTNLVTDMSLNDTIPKLQIQP